MKVFHLNAVLESMAYDVTRLVVKTGQPFEIVFQNGDIMPHNLVIVPAGSRSRTHHVIVLDLGGTKCAVSHFRKTRLQEVLRIPNGGYSFTFDALWRPFVACPINVPLSLESAAEGAILTARSPRGFKLRTAASR